MTHSKMASMIPLSHSNRFMGAVQSLIDWITSHEAEILIALSAGILLYILLRTLRGRAHRMEQLPSGDLSLTAIIGRTFARTSHIFMLLLAARLVAEYANPPAMLLTTLRFLFTISAVFQGAIWLREFILGLIERRAGIDSGNDSLTSAMGLIRLLVTVGLFAVAIIVVLDNLGVNVTGLVAGLGIGGIAIGLAAQGIFSDLFAALSIIFDKPFKVGDTIHYDQSNGVVEHIGLKSTRLRSITGETKIISNAQLLQKEISNYQAIPKRRVSMPLALIYQTPADKAAQVPALVEQIITRQGGEFVRCGLIGFGASSLDFECLFDVPHGEIEVMAAMRHAVGLAIMTRFREEGIEFAYPTQTTFTAAPDGTLVWPYSQPAAVSAPEASRE